jgi:hypothetical protein
MLTIPRRCWVGCETFIYLKRCADAVMPADSRQVATSARRAGAHDGSIDQIPADGVSGFVNNAALPWRSAPRTQ